MKLTISQLISKLQETEKFIHGDPQIVITLSPNTTLKSIAMQYDSQKHLLLVYSENDIGVKS